MWKDDNFEELSGVVTEILDGALKTKSAIECSQDYDELTNRLMKYIAEETEDLPRSFALAASQCLMKMNLWIIKKAETFMQHGLRILETKVYFNQRYSSKGGIQCFLLVILVE